MPKTKVKILKKSKNGFTLISLVVSVIVLLILASISISMLIGTNGILQQVINAKEETAKAQEFEQVQLAVTSAIMSNNELNESNLENELRKENLDGMVITGKESWIYKGNQNNYLINTNGDIIIKNYICGLIYGNEKKLLPEGYQQVEYIKNTGTQWINSGIYSNNNIGIKVKYTAANGSIFGVAPVYRTKYYGLNMFSGNSTYEIYWGTGNDYPKLGKWNYDEKINLEYNYLNDNIISANGTELIKLSDIQNTVEFSDKYPIYIFRLSGSFTQYIVTKVYELTITEDLDIIGNFIPAIDESYKPCLYDTISKQAFYNQGTGEFLAGTKIYNFVGNKNDEEKYDIPITLETIDGNKEMNITLDDPLRKLGDKTDYLDLANHKVVRFINQNKTTGELLLLDKPLEENIEIENVDFNKVMSIKVNTEVEPSLIE